MQQEMRVTVEGIKEIGWLKVLGNLSGSITCGALAPAGRPLQGGLGHSRLAPCR
ncbi:hypothetical protein BHE74_00059786 [Ensete ventricosum]|nr:hypothetical protein BHE74_00059786 [Ensete ventricosum]